MKDERNREYILGEIHTEFMTLLIKEEVKSYKQLPLTLFQIVSSFQDEPRPRFGLMLNREFIKQEAYSFHSCEKSLEENYEQMKQAFENIFTRLNLDYYAVGTDSGLTDNLKTNQFIAKVNEGDRKIAYSSTGSFADSYEEAAIGNHYEKSDEPLEEMEKVKTPNQKTIRQVAAYLEVPIEKCLKTLAYKVDDEIVIV